MLCVGISVGSLPIFSAARGSIDADAALQLARISADSGYSADNAFLSQFIRELKKGSGGSGDCYALCDGIWLPGYCKKDTANKVSKLYDLAKAKPGFGTGGYYDATQATASLQQTLTRADNKGNLLTQSADVASWGNAVAGTGVTPVKTSNFALAPDGTMTAARLQFSLGGGTTSSDQSRVTRNVNNLNAGAAYTSSLWVKLNSGSSPATISLQVSNGGVSFNATVTNQWTKVDVPLNVSAATISFIFGLRGGGSNPDTIDLLVWIPSVRESTWDSDCIPTTSAPIYAGLDGKPVLMFDAGLGLNSGLNVSGTINPANAYTSFVVVRKDGGGTVRRRVFSLRATSGQACPLYYESSTTQIAAVIGAGGAVITNTTQETWGMFTSQADGTNYAIRRKGTSLSTGAGSGGTSDAINIGNDPVLPQPHNGPIAAIISIRQALTTAQRDHIESVLNTFFPSTV